MKKQKEQCSFNHRELPNCDVCEKLGCNHSKETLAEKEIREQYEDLISSTSKEQRWEKEFNEEFGNYELGSDYCEDESGECTPTIRWGIPDFYGARKEDTGNGKLFQEIKSFISAQIQKAREETLKEAIAYLKKKNPIRVPSSVMVDYTEAITDLEKLLKINEGI